MEPLKFVIERLEVRIAPTGVNEPDGQNNDGENNDVDDGTV